VIPADFSCLKEVYCAGDVETHGGVILRSLLAEGDLILGEQNSVVRWASARHMLIGRNATLFGRMVAVQEMCFAGPASFQRIQARSSAWASWRPVMPMGPYREFDITALEHTVFFNDDIQRVVVEGNLTIPDDTVIRGHLVVHGTLKIGHGCYIQGSIKASGNIHIGNAVAVEGAMVSDMSVSCLNDCLLLGPIVAERFVYIGSRCVLGSLHSPISISSSSIRLKLPMLVHGTVWARSRGAIRHERAQLA
jgi:cytoskeletal protein CcmA (bactofilin family)